MELGPPGDAEHPGVEGGGAPRHEDPPPPPLRALRCGYQAQFRLGEGRGSCSMFFLSALLIVAIIACIHYSFIPRLN